jgi:LacI family transcriptional regulator
LTSSATTKSPQKVAEVVKTFVVLKLFKFVSWYYHERFAHHLWEWSMKPTKAVALLIETSNSYARSLLQGIASYMHENELWSIYMTEVERGAPAPSWLENWHGDGVIARIENNSVATAIAKLNIPTVDVSVARPLPEVPYVEIDEEAVGRMAFTHLRERGFEQFAVCGVPRFRWSQLRQAAFVQQVTQAGFPCHCYEPSVESQQHVESIEQEREQLAQWLLSLPHSIGLLAVYDLKAQQILDVCRSFDIRVPEQIAVLGVDNDDVLCDLCTPPLSSIVPAGKRIGREAARILDRLMRGEAPENMCTLVEPIGTVTRQSTDILAIEDKDIAAAVRFIRDHYCDGINVNDVVQAVSVARRSLESRFHECVGRTLHQEITRRRIDRVCSLLKETDLTLAQIAKKSGYQNEEYMSVAFRRAMNVPPGRYRKSS